MMEKMSVRSMRCHRTFYAWKREQQIMVSFAFEILADAYDGNTLWLFVSKDVSIKLLGFPRIGSGTVL
jgi:hypothetical protein